jgi:hypothetical protein
MQSKIDKRREKKHIVFGVWVSSIYYPSIYSPFRER